MTIEDHVSIHAPVRGRICADGYRASSSCFNPRPRAGANQHVERSNTTIDCFNPRPRAGANSIAPSG